MERSELCGISLVCLIYPGAIQDLDGAIPCYSIMKEHERWWLLMDILASVGKSDGIDDLLLNLPKYGILSALYIERQRNLLGPSFLFVLFVDMLAY